MPRRAGERRQALAAVAMLGLLLAAPAEADAPRTAAAAGPERLREVARTALERHGRAIVTVRVVLKRRFISQGRERGSSESQIEIAGTLLTPAGLTVVSDVTTNPAALAGGGDPENRTETQTTDVKLVLRDGREVPARFVLRDQDLDIAFLVPEEAGLELPALDLAAQAAPVPAPLDDLVYLYPLPRSLGRETGVALERVRGVARKPRTFVASELLVGMQSLGCPVFDGNGRVVGLSVMRRAPRTAGAQGSGFRDLFETFTPVVLTAADVQEVARQAQAQAQKAATGKSR